MIKKIPNINARDFPTILGINPYQTAFELLETKIEGKHPFFGNKFTDHGNRYEKTALEIYEKETGNKVDSTQQTHKHSIYEWITGRYDGLTSIHIDKTQEESPCNKKRKLSDSQCIINKKRKISNSCIIEVKCPLKKDRKDPLTEDNIPIYYWAQCQVYMNLLDCELAHYIEFYIEPNADIDSGKLYTLTVKRDREWWNKSLPTIILFYEEVKKYHLLGNLDTHPVRLAENIWKRETLKL
jgi:putative phage-type endonuclease